MSEHPTEKGDMGCETNRYRLSVRCAGCHKITTHILTVPDVEDAPQDVDELLASAFLARQRFECKPCESWIGQVIAASHAAARAA